MPEARKAAPSSTLDSATNPSAAIMTVRRLCRSIQTPAKGPMNMLGKKVTMAARDSVTADSVCTVSHQITENCTTEEPSSEKVCPT